MSFRRASLGVLRACAQACPAVRHVVPLVQWAWKTHSHDVAEAVDAVVVTAYALLHARGQITEVYATFAVVWTADRVHAVVTPYIAATAAAPVCANECAAVCAMYRLQAMTDVMPPVPPDVQRVVVQLRPVLVMETVMAAAAVHLYAVMHNVRTPTDVARLVMPHCTPKPLLAAIGARLTPRTCLRAVHDHMMHHVCPSNRMRRFAK